MITEQQKTEMKNILIGYYNKSFTNEEVIDRILTILNLEKGDTECKEKNVNSVKNILPRMEIVNGVKVVNKN